MEADVRQLSMHDTSNPNRPASTGSHRSEPESHITHIRADRPVEVSFSFEHPQSRVGVGASVASHIAMALIAFLVMRYQPEAQSVEVVPDDTEDLIWLNMPGPGGGGGGGGNKRPEPPKKAELPGKEKITVPITKEPEPKLTPPEEVKPLEELMSIPAKTLADAEQQLAGVIKSEAPTTSQGTGDGGGAGTGKGTGIGEGDGAGLGDGFNRGTGGGFYRPGSGVSSPRVLEEKKPSYTADAMRAKVQGAVWLECIVMPDGTVGNVRVTRSLDSVFGLDQEAIKAARQWKFVPGMREGKPVPVLITIELTFTLR
jgi:periplasmic protein TonB